MTKGQADRVPTSSVVVGKGGIVGARTPPHPLWGAGGGGVALANPVGGGEVGTPHRLIAVDIGSTGAFALFVGGILTEVADMPVLRRWPGMSADRERAASRLGAPLVD